MTTRETGRKLLEQTIKTLTPVTGWHCVTHESENRKTVRMTPVHFIAIVTETWTVHEEEDVRQEGGVAHTSITMRNEKRDSLYGVVYDLENYDDGLCFAHQMHDFIALAEPNTATDRFWDDVAQQRVEQEEADEQRASARQAK